MTEKEGFQAVIYFLEKWHEITQSDDIAEILSLMEPLPDGKPADPVTYDYWLEAIEKIKQQGGPPIKKLQ